METVGKERDGEREREQGQSSLGNKLYLVDLCIEIKFTATVKYLSYT